MSVKEVGRGHGNYACYSNREPGVFVVAIGEFFSVSPKWHRQNRVLPLVRQYQLTLDAILREHPNLAGCAVGCHCCGIRFLTHPRNAGREDLHCEFGCREYQRRKLANARSQKHYQTDQGWWKKKLLNRKRGAAAGKDQHTESPAATSSDTAPADGGGCSSEPSLAIEPASELPSPASHPATQIAPEEPPDENVQLTLEGFTLDEVMLVNSSTWPCTWVAAGMVGGWGGAIGGAKGGAVVGGMVGGPWGAAAGGVIGGIGGYFGGEAATEAAGRWTMERMHETGTTLSETWNRVWGS